MSNINKIQCPHCDHLFDVEDALASHLEKEYKVKLKKAKQEFQRDLDNRLKSLEEDKRAFEEKKRKENDLFKEKLEKAIDKKEDGLRKKIEEDYRLMTESQKKDLIEKQQQINDLKGKEIELEKVRMKMSQQEKDIELKYQKILQGQIKEREELIAKRLQEQIELKLVEKDKQLEDQNKLIEELKRKKDQGSMQLQGEVQEIAIEEMLRSAFPGDTIEEVPKGVRGADCVQHVINDMLQPCGRIILESKRTKAFSAGWIEKLKSDQRAIGAELAVLVTATKPKGQNDFKEHQGVWICDFNEFIGVVQILRYALIRAQRVATAQENKGDKMELLYNFLTGDEFKQQISAIVEGFTQMKEELDKEKRAMLSIWKKREKQIEKVTQNTINMHASISGIAGSSIPSLEILELPSEDEDK